MKTERSRTAQFAGAVALAACAALAAACGGSNNTTTVTGPTGTPVTETFTGTLQPMSVDTSHTFTVTVGGPLIVTLTQLSPSTFASIFVNMGVGTPGASGVCSIAPGNSTSAQPSITAQLSLSAPPGTYCLAVQEFQGLGPVSYTVTVAHT
jgi:hypothetical protein